MNERQFFQNPDFVAYVRMLHQLHGAIREGWDETDKGEALRDRMDEPWHNFSGDEVASLSGISADLDSLSGPPASDIRTIAADAKADLDSALEARKTGDFIGALEILRKHAGRIPAASLAYLRGQIWLEAGEYPIAAEFLQRASDLEPDNSNFRYIALHALGKSDPLKAADQARAILAESPRNPPELVLKAADILADQARILPSDQTRRELKSLIRPLQDSIFRLETSGEGQVHPDLLIRADGLIDACRRQVG